MHIVFYYVHIFSTELDALWISNFYVENQDPSDIARFCTIWRIKWLTYLEYKTIAKISQA